MGKVKELFIEAGEDLVNEGISDPTDEQILERVKEKVEELEREKALDEMIAERADKEREAIYHYFDMLEDNGMEKANNVK